MIKANPKLTIGSLENDESQSVWASDTTKDSERDGLFCSQLALFTLSCIESA